MTDEILRKGIELQDEIIHVEQIHDLIENNLDNQILIQYGSDMLSIPHELKKKFEIVSWEYFQQLKYEFENL